MRKGDLVFVYGTLRPGMGANGYMTSGGEHRGQSQISAYMYNAGWYPGVKLATEGGQFVTEGPKVVGDLYEVVDERLPSLLDSYEGYPNLYDRAEVETACGRKAWVYTYNPITYDDQLISSGDWSTTRNVEA